MRNLALSSAKFAAVGMVLAGGGLTFPARAAEGVLDISGAYSVTDDTLSELNGYSAVNLSSASSCLTIDIANDAEITCLITNKGSVVKTGAGILQLANNSLTDGFNVQSGWRIEAGGVALPTVRTTGDGGYRLTKVYIGKDAQLRLCPVNDTSHQLNLAGGEGVITNLATSGFAGSSLSGTFGGTICPRISYGVAYNTFTFTGENHAGGNGSGIEDGRLNVARSDGLGDAYQFEFGYNAILRYIGTGDATWQKRFFVKNSNYAGIDGGDGGGLTVDPLEFFELNSYVKDFYFDGAGGTNVFQLSAHTAPLKGSATRIVKKGAGAWRFRHDYRGYERGGATEVREGKLIIDGLFDKGEICALGVGTNAAMSVKTPCAYSEDVAVPYGVLLSGGELEFVGSTNAAFAADRGIGVSADSALTDNGQAVAFGFAGVRCVGETPRTLTLGGTNALSRLDEVTDGDAALSLRKVGPGTWTLGGNQTFSGTLDVREGTVRVLNDGDRTKFTYFRISLKECAYTRLGIGDEGGAYVWQFGLFDADGYRLGLKVTDAPTFGNGDLRENEVGWARDTELFNHVDSGDQGGTPRRLFCEGWYFGYSKALIVTQSTFSDRRPHLDIPRTWQRFVVRLPDDVAAVASYDIVTPSPTGKNGSSIVSWSLDGSVDGLYWTELDSKEYPELMQKGTYKGSPSDTEMYWVSDNSQWVRTTTTAKPTHTGFPVTASRAAKTYSQLANATVRVASGTSLVADGDVTISSLSADAEAGMGEIRGFTFAKGGTLALTNVPREGATFAKALAEATDAANLESWSLTVNGRANANFDVRVDDDGTVSVLPRGLIFIIR